MVKGRALGGEAWGGGEPALSVMETRQAEVGSQTLSDSFVSYPPPRSGRHNRMESYGHLILSLTLHLNGLNTRCGQLTILLSLRSP